jgi:hypothetical protein
VCLDIWEGNLNFDVTFGLKLWSCWALNLQKCLLGFLYCEYEYFELWRVFVYVCVCVSNCAFDGFWVLNVFFFFL